MDTAAAAAAAIQGKVATPHLPYHHPWIKLSTYGGQKAWEVRDLSHAAQKEKTVSLKEQPEEKEIRHIRGSLPKVRSSDQPHQHLGAS